MKIRKRLTRNIVIAVNKNQGLVVCLVDINTKNVYAANDLDENHINMAMKLININNVREVIMDNSLVQHLVPLVIEIKDEQVISICIGWSAMTKLLEIKYTKKSLDSAERIIMKFIIKGIIPISDEFEIKY